MTVPGSCVCLHVAQGPVFIEFLPSTRLHRDADADERGASTGPRRQRAEPEAKQKMHEIQRVIDQV